MEAQSLGVSIPQREALLSVIVLVLDIRVINDYDYEQEHEHDAGPTCLIAFSV
jgi:hypothetical protein